MLHAIDLDRARAGQPIPVLLDREGRDRTLTITPRNVDGAGRVGVSFEPSSWVFEKRALRLRDVPAWRESLARIRQG